MEMETVAEYRARREEENRSVLDRADLSIRRFFALDHDVYGDGALAAKVKELLGLVASAVLRCDDCIRYHIDRAWSLGATGEEITEALGVSLVVGGSIIIPSLRCAFSFLEAIEAGGRARPQEERQEEVR